MSNGVHDIHRDAVIARLGRLQTFVKTAFTALIVLTILSEQEIREHRREAAVLLRERRVAAARLPVHLQQINRLGAELRKEIGAATSARLAPLDVARKEESAADYATLAARLGLTPADLPELQEAVRYLAGSAQTLQSGLHAYRQIREKVTGLADADEAALTRMFRLPPPKKATEPPAEIARLRGLLKARETMYRSALAVVDRFEDAYKAYFKDKNLLNERKAAVDALERGKQTFPSPFGTFHFHPKLALLLLALAAAISYIVFVWSQRRLFRIAREIASPAPIVAPSWLYVPAPELRPLFTTAADHPRSRAVVAAVVHAAWIGVSLFLLVEVFRYGAGELLRVLPRPVTATSVIALNAFALAMAAVFFVPEARQRHAWARAAAWPPRLSRRSAVRLSLAGFFGMLASDWSWPKPRDTAAETWPPLTMPWPGQLVRNRVSTVVHSPRMCRNHLPQWPGEVSPGPPRIHPRGIVVSAAYANLHRQHAAGILFDIARQARRQLEQEPFSIQNERVDTILDLLGRALYLQPWSFHLHDEVISLLGRRKTFADIRDFLAEWRELAEEELKKNPDSEVARMRVREVARRIHGVERRERRAAERAKKREEDAQKQNG